MESLAQNLVLLFLCHFLLDHSSCNSVKHIYLLKWFAGFINGFLVNKWCCSGHVVPTVVMLAHLWLVSSLSKQFNLFPRVLLNNHLTLALSNLQNWILRGKEKNNNRQIVQLIPLYSPNHFWEQSLHLD